MTVLPRAVMGVQMAPADSGVKIESVNAADRPDAPASTSATSSQSDRRAASPIKTSSARFSAAIPGRHGQSRTQTAGREMIGRVQVGGRAYEGDRLRGIEQSAARTAHADQLGHAAGPARGPSRSIASPSSSLPIPISRSMRRSTAEWDRASVQHRRLTPTRVRPGSQSTAA